MGHMVKTKGPFGIGGLGGQVELSGKYPVPDRSPKTWHIGGKHRTARNTDIAGDVITPGGIGAVCRKMIDHDGVIGAVVVLHDLTRGRIVIARIVDGVFNDDNGVSGMSRGPLEGDGVSVDRIVRAAQGRRDTALNDLARIESGEQRALPLSIPVTSKASKNKGWNRRGVDPLNQRWMMRPESHFPAPSVSRHTTIGGWPPSRRIGSRPSVEAAWNSSSIVAAASWSHGKVTKLKTKVIYSMVTSRSDYARGLRHRPSCFA